MSVVEGTLGERVLSGSDELYAFHIDQVWYGPFFLEGSMDGDPYQYGDSELAEPQRAFLVPGVLLPNLTLIRTIFDTLGYELHQ